VGSELYLSQAYSSTASGHQVLHFSSSSVSTDSDDSLEVASAEETVCDYVPAILTSQMDGLHWCNQWVEIQKRPEGIEKYKSMALFSSDFSHHAEHYAR
jgi:hypothetical protein